MCQSTRFRLPKLLWLPLVMTSAGFAGLLPSPPSARGQVPIASQAAPAVTVQTVEAATPPSRSPTPVTRAGVVVDAVRSQPQLP
ncbi:hypothetical protein, partial [Trichothermofontia sp.]